MESNVASLLPELKFVMFENKSNNCWLDASMALVAHNKVLKIIANCNPISKLYEIVSTYSQAVAILNDDSISNIELRIKIAKERLQKLQNSTLAYLQPKLKCQNGEPESAFCALLNLIHANKCIEESLSITWLWKKKCLVCNTSKLSRRKKPIITLSKVNYFLPNCPTSVYLCSCKTEQEMTLIYKELPPCLFFHFENGAGKEESLPLFFTIQDRKYQLTGVITLEKGEDSAVNHFITWIRDPKSNKWLECNDLNTDIVSFASETPVIDLKDVYMYVYESPEKVDTISIAVPADLSQEEDSSNTCVEIIDLSNESEDTKLTAISSPEEQIDDSKKSSTNVPLYNISEQSPLEPIKERKCNETSSLVIVKQSEDSSTSEEDTKTKSNIVDPLGTLNETESQKLSKSNKEKLALRVGVQEINATKDIDLTNNSKNSSCPSILNKDQKKQSISCTNILRKDDSLKILPVEINEKEKPKVDYSKTLIKTVREYHPKKRISMFPHMIFKNEPIKTNVSYLDSLQKKSEPIIVEVKVADINESNQVGSSHKKQSTNNSQKKNNSECTQQRIKEITCNKLQFKLPDVSIVNCSSLEPDCQKLSNLNAKNVIVPPEKNYSFIGDTTDEEKSIVNKNKLSDICSIKNEDEKVTNELKTLDIYEHLDRFPSILQKMEIFQNDASSKGKKRKHLCEQDIPGNSDNKFAIEHKSARLDHECNDLTESSMKAQRTSSRKPSKNRKYITDYYDSSIIPLPKERKKNVNITRVSTANKWQANEDEKNSEDHNQLPVKSAMKLGENLSEHKLKKLIDLHVERGFAAFMEQVLDRHKISL